MWFSRKKRVYIGSLEVAGVCESLAKGLNAKGWETYSLKRQKNRFAYRDYNQSFTLSILQKAIDRLGNASGKTRKKWRLHKLEKALLYLAVVWTALRCKHVVFIFGFTLFDDHKDLKLFQKLGCKTYNIFVGSDSRPPYLDENYLIGLEDRIEQVEEVIQRTEMRKAQLDTLAAHTDVIIENSMTGLFQPKPFVSWHSLGFPAANMLDSLDGRTYNEIPTILHAPSHEGIKGTEVIERVLDELEAEGVAFNYVPVKGVSYEKFIETLKQADIVIDQMYSDTPLPGVSKDAAAFGCSVIIGGHCWQEIKEIVAEENLAPTIQVTDSTLKDTLRKLIGDSKWQQSNASELHSFVKQKWNCESVAERYIQMFEGNIPSDWWVDPKDIPYVGGMGANPQQKYAKLVKEMVTSQGVDSLKLAEDSKALAKIKELYLTEK